MTTRTVLVTIGAMLALTGNAYAHDYEAPHVCEGRMTGGGSLFTCEGERVTHGFTLYCDPEDGTNRLQVNFDTGTAFHMEELLEAYCIDDPSIDPENPDAPIDTFFGFGVGRINKFDGDFFIDFIFTDAGERGDGDVGVILITDENGDVVLFVEDTLTFGNHQAHRLTGSHVD